MNKLISGVSIFIIMCMAIIFIACLSITHAQNEIIPVGNFDVNRYLGDWYEIGRFDFKWEQNLKNVRANYSLNSNGTIRVTNTGFDYISAQPKKSIGKAKFASKQKDVADLKVSFFGPFYSAYRVIALDPEYKYALVAGANNKLLWILSRTSTIPDDVRSNYINIAQSVGYDLKDFVWTIQE